MTASSPSLSVAMPTYSRPALLLQALESVLAQTRPADEIIVSDNASPDDTAERVLALAQRHPQLRLLRQPKNLGGVELRERPRIFLTRPV